jgi:hypothetical protein
MRTSLHALLACSAALSLTPPPARACGNALSRSEGEAIYVQYAEASEDEGFHTRTLMFMHRLPIAQLELGRSPLYDRALRLSALAVVRTGGRIDREGKPADAERAKELLGWAEKILTAWAAASPDDPKRKIDLAELQVALERREAASATLVDLEKRGLVASFRGHAALARLRRAAGEGAPPFVGGPLGALQAASAELSLARCTRMTKHAPLCSGQDDARAKEKPVAFPPMELPSLSAGRM